MMYPEQLVPNGIERIKIGNEYIEVPKCSLQFKIWQGMPISNTFGGKNLVDVDGEPMFAELAIVALFNKAGWQSRWISTYGKKPSEPLLLTKWKDDVYKNQEHVPIEDPKVLSLLNAIAQQNGNSFSGCWDVVGWNNESLLFAESKRYRRDAIRSTQLKWVNAALSTGLTLDNFLIVEWDQIQ